jgi:hypothetical protein
MTSPLAPSAPIPRIDDPGIAIGASDAPAEPADAGTTLLLIGPAAAGVGGAAAGGTPVTGLTGPTPPAAAAGGGIIVIGGVPPTGAPTDAGVVVAAGVAAGAWAATCATFCAMFVPTLVAALTAFVAELTVPEAIRADDSANPDPRLAKPGARPAALAAFAPPVAFAAFAPLALASWLDCAAVAGLVAALLDAGDDDEAGDELPDDAGFII